MNSEKREKNIVSLSLLWHFGEQKREINTYVLSIYESHLIFAGIHLNEKNLKKLASSRFTFLWFGDTQIANEHVWFLSIILSINYVNTAILEATKSQYGSCRIRIKYTNYELPIYKIRERRVTTDLI